jgi:hypothetical protein
VYGTYVENEELFDGRQLTAQFAFHSARPVVLLLFLLQATSKLQVGVKGRRRCGGGRGRRLGGRSRMAPTAAAASVTMTAFLFLLQSPCELQVSLQ